MSLIFCPECNKQVSDKATACPNCGFPISETIESSDCYDIILNGIFGNRSEIIDGINKYVPMDLIESVNVTKKIPCILKTNVKTDDAERIKFELEKLGANIIIRPHSDKESLESFLRSIKTDIITCPHCGSTAVTIGQKGYSLLTGFLGSGKTVNRCGKCGWTWEPKR